MDLKLNHEEARARIKAAAESSLAPDFGAAFLASVIVTSLGLLLNNWPLIVVGVILSPSLSVFLHLSFDLARFDWSAALRSFCKILVIFSATALIGFLTGFIFHPAGIYPTAVLNFYPTLGALVATTIMIGFVVFLWLSNSVSEKVMAIVFQLILILPILAATISLDALDWLSAAFALQLFIINFVLIILVPLIIIYFLLFYSSVRN